MSEIDEATRNAMNRLYKEGVHLRQAQRTYFRNRTQENLYKAKDAEQRFDDALRACHDLGKPTQQPLIFTP